MANGDVRALSRAIRMVEDGDPGAEQLLRELGSGPRRSHVSGLTGPPGSGKSTLCDDLIAIWRQRGQRVSIVAVDPSSPFSGGAILGDRVRMQDHALDRDVFIRSMAARGHLGGLASATRHALRLIDAAGYDQCLVETVGVGQSELEVMRLVDTTVVVTTPVSGDGVQMIKAGILEIADIFVVNKGDLPGTLSVVKGLREVARNSPNHSHWEPPVLVTTATSASGVVELADAIDRHQKLLAETAMGEDRSRQRWLGDLEAIVVDKALEQARKAFARLDLSGDSMYKQDPYTLAEEILSGRLTEVH